MEEDEGEGVRVGKVGIALLAGLGSLGCWGEGYLWVLFYNIEREPVMASYQPWIKRSQEEPRNGESVIKGIRGVKR